MYLYSWKIWIPRLSGYRLLTRVFLVINCKIKWIEEVKKVVKVEKETDLKVDRFDSSSITKMTLATWLGGARDILTRQAEMIEKMQEIIELQKTEALADKGAIIKLQSEMMQTKDSVSSVSCSEHGSGNSSERSSTVQCSRIQEHCSSNCTCYIY